MAFTEITIIYNPNSTGSGEGMAKQFKKDYQAADKTIKVVLKETKYAGHAEKLAYDIAKKQAKPMIISASGDGGYHEVVNGALRAQAEGAAPTTGVLPAGNANDHFNDVHKGDLIHNIINEKIRSIDVLQLSTTVKGKPYERYAHSYIGFGLTPKVGQELNEVELNLFKEIWIVTRAFFSLQPVSVIIDGTRRKYDSLIFSNIGKMSKMLALSKDYKNNDGKFEVTIFQRRNKFRLFLALLRASTTGLMSEDHLTEYKFKTRRSVLTQLDGEITKVDEDTDVVITIRNKLLHCIV